jgi:hypothetical protein
MPPFQSHRLARHAVSLLVVFLALFALRPAMLFAQAGGNAGTVSEVSGTVQIQRGAATIPVTQGMPVQVGDRIVTGDDGHVVVLLTDQSTLELNDSSNMVVTAHSGSATRVDLATGVVRSFVNRTVGAAAPNFEVHTPNAVAAARGTLFDVSYVTNVTRPTYGDVHNFTDVSVYDGIVDFWDIANVSFVVNVPSGYESTAAGNNSPTSPGPLGMTGARAGHGGKGKGGGGGGGPAGGGPLGVVSTVPPPSCPVCPTSSTNPGGGGTGPAPR